ncbi:MAG: zinc-binding dehydrogenase [Xanthobacteraceae bacterium]|nr:zinc-binding dehydrogenase [Xanthobacteraceae bacterium]
MAGLELRTLMTRAGALELSLQRLGVPEPAADEVVVRVEATPINPSDLALLLGPVDPATLTSTGAGDDVVVRGQVPEPMLKAFAARLDQSMPVGNEGAGTVVRTGSSEAARALEGRLVAMIGGAMYSRYRVIKAADCLVLPKGATAAQGASCFVNPLTSLGMTETMRREGHKALVHTAAASNLGQMLNRICLKDGIALVNIVRSAEQEKILRQIGAVHVVNSTAPGFMNDLTQALVDTGATIAFDAIGGGRLAGQILTAMEAAINRNAATYSRYGSNVHKQVYVYGSLDPAPIELARGVGMAWGVGGWLLFPFLQKIGAADAARLRQRVVDELTTTFASHYTRTVSLRGALSLDNIKVYGRRATGEKFLIDPSRAD